LILYLKIKYIDIDKPRMRERLEDGLVEVEVEGKKIGGNIFKCFRGLHGNKNKFVESSFFF